MKYRVVACGVFEPYIKALAAECPHELDVRILDAGLHSRPNDLRLMAQAEIDEAARVGGFDAVVLLYGLCGRGTAGLEARNVPVVIPRAHDCITLFMGSDEEYKRQFASHPGTFYHTLGWIEKKINPKNREAVDLYANYAKLGYEVHPDFARLQSRYGEENAKHILAFMDRWKKHYSRAAYIDMGFEGEDKYVNFTRAMAEAFDWRHETIAGDPSLIKNVLFGDWTDSRVLVIPPGCTSVSTGDDRILAVVSIDTGGGLDLPGDSDMIVDLEEAGGESSGLGLGIDAGGTYTDAVIYDLGEKRLLAKAKSLTTYHDLLVGIRGALNQLPADLLSQVHVTSLSTTLATNSIVEGRGHKVGLIALTPWGWTEEQIGHGPLVNVPGSVSITGDIIEPLDEDAARKAAKYLVEQEKCAAVVVAGYATVRNPEQANRVREIIQESYDVPVMCSHEVSRRLNGIHGAQTAIANGSLLPIVRDLIDAVHRALADYNVPGKLMVVKGDGTPVDESVARARPVETILSGPAASVSGARIISGLDNAMVLDIGGTTTDCAIIEDGNVAVSEEGARVGSWVMSIDAAEISTAGLGGDSRIDFTRDRAICVGPTRNIPLSYLAAEYKTVEDWLNRFEGRRHKGDPDASALDILVLGGSSAIVPTQRESVLLNLLSDGPMPALEVARRMDVPSPVLLPTSRLESCGMIKRSALTPTDLLHVTGRFVRWNRSAAELALNAFAHIYGRVPEEVLELALTAVTRKLFEEIVRREVAWENRKLYDLPEEWKFLLDKAFCDSGSGLSVSFALSRPIVAIGAPAEALVPPVAQHLNANIVVPEHADVANAIGAIASDIRVREEIIIRPGQFSNYTLHGAEERMEFTELDKATLKAAEIAKERARRRAIQAGAISPGVKVTRSDSVGSASDGGRVFLERRVIAVATGAFARDPKKAALSRTGDGR